jgi:hypothetical protein
MCGVTFMTAKIRSSHSSGTQSPKMSVMSPRKTRQGLRCLSSPASTFWSRNISACSPPARVNGSPLPRQPFHAAL